MGTITYFPKGSSYSATQGITLIYPSVTPKMILIIGPGIGESNVGDLTGCKKSSGWGGWGNIKVAADIYGIIQIYINTTEASAYSNNEYENAVTWARNRYSNLTNSIWILGHSFGSYGAGKFAFKDTTMCSRVAGWIVSGSGNFVPFALTDGNLWQNLVNNGVKVWGVHAAGDCATGPTPIRELYTQMKALSASARVIKSEFPLSEWPIDCKPSGAASEDPFTRSSAAHNAVLNRITSRPMYYSKGNFSLITTGITSSLLIKMNIYQWMLSNPRTSIYQDPTLSFTAPKYSTTPTTPPPTPTTTVYYKQFIDTRDNNFGVTWSDNTSTVYTVPDGYTVDHVRTGFSSVDGESREFLKIKMLSGATVLEKQFGPKKV